VTLATAKVPQHIIQSKKLVAVSCETGYPNDTLGVSAGHTE